MCKREHIIAAPFFYNTYHVTQSLTQRLHQIGCFPLSGFQCFPTELNERYSRLAKETGRSRSFYVNEALQEAIDRFEYEYGILKDIEDYRAGRLETYSIDEVRAHCGLAN